MELCGYRNSVLKCPIHNIVHPVIAAAELRGEGAARIKHYTLPASRIAGPVHAYRCSECEFDFHIDFEPTFCPRCGTLFSTERQMGFRPAANPAGAKAEAAGNVLVGGLPCST